MPSRIVQRAVLATAIAAVIAIASTPARAATVDPFAHAAPKPDDPPTAPAPGGTAAQQDPDPDGVAAPAPTPAANTGSASPPSEPSQSPPSPVPPKTPPAGTMRDCVLSFDAAPFLRAATERGIQPRVAAGSACDMNPTDNQFFGRGGDLDCRLQFDNARWLRKDMRFTDITGVGSFEAKSGSGGLEVSIPADGGVRFRRVSVQARVKGGVDCPAAKPANVLAD